MIDEDEQTILQKTTERKYEDDREDKVHFIWKSDPRPDTNLK